jgi:hypothetical protein
MSKANLTGVQEDNGHAPILYACELWKEQLLLAWLTL